MIKPIDIKTQKFKKGLFGYKASDVDSFVDSVYRAYEEVYNERNKFEEDLEKLNSSLQENRLKMFELENQVAKADNASSFDDTEAKKKADEIIKNAEAQAAKIIANAKAQSAKVENDVKVEPVKEEPKVEPVKEEPVKESASSRFFKKAEEDVKPAANSSDEDDDEIFVGEIEDARKPDRMMIGDGEEEEEADFEFL
ncbi:MAG: DivIVA domain-containing protein [Lachnospiraceae bacterium]|nr:DivIVA domain-containing protein [Lachnospiraceae bacterium]